MATDDMGLPAAGGGHETSRTGPVAREAAIKAALDRLGSALRETASALARAEPLTPAAAFTAVADAQEALEAAPRFFAALRPLMRLGESGPDCSGEIAQQAERFAAVVRETAPYRIELARLIGSEQRLRNAEREQAQIIEHIDELRRLEQIEGGLDQLRAQRDALQSRTAEVARALAEASPGIATASDEFVSLSTDLLELLAADAKDALFRAREQSRVLDVRLAASRSAAQRSAAEAARLRSELAGAEAESSAAEERLELARQELTERLAALRRHALADRAVCVALLGPAASAPDMQAEAERPDPGSARAELDQAELRLAAADAALSQALRDRDGARQEASHLMSEPPSQRATSIPDQEQE